MGIMGSELWKKLLGKSTLDDQLESIDRAKYVEENKKQESINKMAEQVKKITEQAAYLEQFRKPTEQQRSLYDYYNSNYRPTPQGIGIMEQIERGGAKKQEEKPSVESIMKDLDSLENKLNHDVR